MICATYSCSFSYSYYLLLINVTFLIVFRGGGLLLRYASQNSLDESSQKQVPRSGRRERTPYRNSSHTVRAFEVLHSLRRYVVLL